MIIEKKSNVNSFADKPARQAEKIEDCETGIL
jgi:hypothetical protein